MHMIHVSYKCSSLGWNPKISPGFFCVVPLTSHIPGVFPNDPQLDLGRDGRLRRNVHSLAATKSAQKRPVFFAAPYVGKRKSWGIFGAIRSFAYTVDVWNHSYPLVNLDNYRKSPFFNGKTHYKWAMFRSFLYVYQRVQVTSYCIPTHGGDHHGLIYS